MNHAKSTPEAKSAFLAALSECASVSRAAKAIGCHRTTVYNWREEDEVFAKGWAKAMGLGVEALEDECKRRAFEGYDRPVFYEGKQCGSIRQYSDTLAVFLLKAHAPDKYRERSNVELVGTDGGPIKTEGAMSDAQIAHSALNALNARYTLQKHEAEPEDGSDLV